jgi:hypothetical protein
MLDNSLDFSDPSSLSNKYFLTESLKSGKSMMWATRHCVGLSAPKSFKFLEYVNGYVEYIYVNVLCQLTGCCI